MVHFIKVFLSSHIHPSKFIQAKLCGMNDDKKYTIAALPRGGYRCMLFTLHIWKLPSSSQRNTSAVLVKEEQGFPERRRIWPAMQ
jgi:hypothetical protein